MNEIFTRRSVRKYADKPVEKEKVEIEPKNSTDSSDNELDNIMKKLSSMNNSDDEDNYTNIF